MACSSEFIEYICDTLAPLGEGSTYWNMVYGKNIGDVLNEEVGMTNMRNLGENMSFVLKKFRL